MLSEVIKKRIEKRPFEPFRMHISNGDEVEVRHPELAFLTRSTVVVGQGGRDGIADYALEYNLIHIVKIGPTNGHSNTPRNGGGKRPSKRK